MKRRINQTGRRRIRREHVHLALRSVDGAERPIFDLTLDLSSYPFDPDATVRVEARRGNASQRWEYGSVAQRDEPPAEKRRITEVDSAAQFRVFVVAADGSGRLLGHADRLRPEQSIESLLPLKRSDEIGEEVWRVAFDESGDQPELLVNAKTPDISARFNAPAFFALVVPAVFRTILTHIVIIDPQEQDDDGGGWHIEWLDLAQKYANGTTPPYLRGRHDDEAGVEEARAWIDQVVQTFASKTMNAANAYAGAVRI